jgi:hypothetical protein
MELITIFFVNDCTTRCRTNPPLCYVIALTVIQPVTLETADRSFNIYGRMAATPKSAMHQNKFSELPFTFTVISVLVARYLW